MMTFNVVVAGGAILHLFNTLILCPARCFLGRFLPIVALKDDATCAYNRMQPFFQIFILSMTFLMVGTSNFVFGFYEADGKWVRISMRFVDSCISPNLIAACAVGLLTCAIWLGALLLKNVFFSLKSGISNVRGWCCTKKEE